MSLVVLLLAASMLIAPPPRRLSGAVTTTADTTTDARADDPLAQPAAYDLFAACLRSGLPAEVGARAAAMAAPGAMARDLRRSADLVALGADPVAVWSRADLDPATCEVAAIARRSARSGASMAAALEDLARERRADLEDVADARAERAGVLIAGPLGLCFLPAFVCLGIVPVVIGLVDGLVGGGSIL